MDSEIEKLVLLLQQIVHEAGFAILNRSEQCVTAYSVQTFNQVQSRLAALLPTQINTHELDLNTSPGSLRIAARDLESQVRGIQRKKKRAHQVSGFLLLAGAFCLWNTQRT